MSDKKANDQKVQALLDKVNEQKQEVERLSKRPSWRTNCAFTFDDRNISSKMLNLNTANDERTIVLALAYLIEKERAWNDARKELGLDKQEFEWNGFKISDWREDFKARLDRVTIEDKKKALKTMEAKLSKLMSEEARTSKELEEIEKLLGN